MLRKEGVVDDRSKVENKAFDAGRFQSFGLLPWLGDLVWGCQAGHCGSLAFPHGVQEEVPRRPFLAFRHLKHGGTEVYPALPSWYKLPQCGLEGSLVPLVLGAVKTQKAESDTTRIPRSTSAAPQSSFSLSSPPKYLSSAAFTDREIASEGPRNNVYCSTSNKHFIT